MSSRSSWDGKPVTNIEAFYLALEQDAKSSTGRGIQVRGTISRADIEFLQNEYSIKWPYWLTNTTNNRYKYGSGMWRLPSKAAAERNKVEEDELYRQQNPSTRTPRQAPQQNFNFNLPSSIDSVDQTPPEPETMSAPNIVGGTPQVGIHLVEGCLVPNKEDSYVPFGEYATVRNIIQSKIFYPIYVTGLSGNGKTMMVEQACAELGRELLRVNFTEETDETDLLGSFRLQDGTTAWQDGPVVLAMERGAVLLLDEIDLGSYKIMALQPVLEGKGIFLKKIGRFVKPKRGFTIIATANTKGRGDSGKFVGTNILNEALMDRFPITIEQDYPPVAVGYRILYNCLKSLGFTEQQDTKFVECVSKWSDVIRESYKSGAVDDIISTRREVNIVKAYVMFNRDKKKAIQLNINRFDTSTQQSFLNLYATVDADFKDGANDGIESPEKDNQ